jgi:hypothetical protein
MNCSYQSPRDQIGFTCSLNRYGGRPHALACQQCMADGENTEEFSRNLEAIFAASHPHDRPQISGCCDSALDSPH